MARSEPPSESPAALAARIASGQDPEAESRLVSRYARGVRLVLARHTRDREVAEDLFQDTFQLGIAKLRAGELRDPSKVGAFLASLGRNLATEHYRKAARRRTDADSEAAESVAVDPAGQLGNVLRSEEATLVRRTLADLPTARDREVLFRFYIAEEDRTVIARDLGLSSLQLNRILHRARQRYKARWIQRLAMVATGTTGLVLVFFLFARATFGQRVSPKQ